MLFLYSASFAGNPKIVPPFWSWSCTFRFDRIETLMNLRYLFFSLVLLVKFEATGGTCYALFNRDRGVPSYSTHNGLIELPTVLDSVVEKARQSGKSIRLVFAQSNFGEAYAKTPHNAGLLFMQMQIPTLRAVGLQSGVAPKEKEIQPFTFDDGSIRFESKLFETERGRFRTGTGDVRVIETDRSIVVISEFFGDYNYTGPFVVSLMKKLGITGQDLLIVRDDLKSVGVSSRFGELKAEGNNGIRSILTSQTEFVMQRVKSELPKWLEAKGFKVQLDLDVALEAHVRDLYSDENLRFSHGEDFITRMSSLFKNIFQVLPERERKGLLKQWTEQLRLIVKETMIGHELLLGTASDMQSFLANNPDKQQIDFVLTPMLALESLNGSAYELARQSFFDFIQQK